MRETLDVIVMIKMLLLFTVVGLSAPPRHVKRNITVVTKTNQYEEYQVYIEKPQRCAEEGHESFVIEPDFRGYL